MGCQVHLLRLGHKRGRVLQDQTTRGKNDGRLREVQQLLPGNRGQMRVLQAGLERERVLREEPIYFRLREVQLLQGKQCQVPLLRRGHKRGRVLQEEPIYWRLREVQLLQGKQYQVPLLRRGHKRGRVLQEEPIFWRLREVQELLPGSRGQVRGLQAG